MVEDTRLQYRSILQNRLPAGNGINFRLQYRYTLQNQLIAGNGRKRPTAISNHPAKPASCG